MAAPVRFSRWLCRAAARRFLPIMPHPISPSQRWQRAISCRKIAVVILANLGIELRRTWRRDDGAGEFSFSIGEAFDVPLGELHRLAGLDVFAVVGVHDAAVWQYESDVDIIALVARKLEALAWIVALLAQQCAQPVRLDGVAEVRRLRNDVSAVLLV